MARPPRQLLISTALALGGSALLLHQDLLPSLKEARPLYDALRAFPLILLALAAFFAARINQTRMMALGLLLMLADGLLVARSLPQSGERAAAIALALPILAVFLFRFGEAAVLSWVTAGRLFALVTAISMLVFFATSAYPPFLRAVHWQLSGAYNGWPLPDLAILFWFGLVGTVALEQDRHVRRFLSSFALALIPVFVAMAIARGPMAHLGSRVSLELGFAAGAVVLLYGLFEIYWEKVYLDELTAVPNRRALNEHLRTLGGRYAIAMVDIDFFKKFNDTYGHEEGDNVLRMVATHLQEAAGARVFRYGGEEFCIVYGSADADSVYDRLDRTRESLARREFTIRLPKAVRKKTTRRDRKPSTAQNRKKLKVTVSMGLAEPDLQGMRGTVEAVMGRADKALYRAKREGRNRVVLA